MNSDRKKELWQHALSRFQLIDWEAPVTQAQVNDLQGVLSTKLENEETYQWLERVLITAKKTKQESINTWIQRILTILQTEKEENTPLSSQKIAEYINVWVQHFLETTEAYFNPFTEIVRKAAASVTTDDYPLPDNAPLITEDDYFQFEIKKQNEAILIKAQALGIAIEDFANTPIGLSDYEMPNKVLVVIILNHLGDGEIHVKDTSVIRKMLSNPIIGRIE